MSDIHLANDHTVGSSSNSTATVEPSPRLSRAEAIDRHAREAAAEVGLAWSLLTKGERERMHDWIESWAQLAGELPRAEWCGQYAAAFLLGAGLCTVPVEDKGRAWGLIEQADAAEKALAEAAQCASGVAAYRGRAWQLQSGSEAKAAAAVRQGRRVAHFPHDALLQAIRQQGEQGGLTVSGLLMFLDLQCAIDDSPGGTVMRSNVEIADRLGISERTAKECTKQLSGSGLLCLVREGSKGAPNIWGRGPSQLDKQWGRVGFFPKPATLRAITKQGRLTSSGVAMLLYLLSHIESSPDGTFTCGNAEIAERLGIGKDAVRTNAKQLTDSGLLCLTRKGSKGAPSVWGRGLFLLDGRLEQAEQVELAWLRQRKQGAKAEAKAERAKRQVAEVERRQQEAAEVAGAISGATPIEREGGASPERGGKLPLIPPERGGKLPPIREKVRIDTTNVSSSNTTNTVVTTITPVTTDTQVAISNNAEQVNNADTSITDVGGS